MFSIERPEFPDVNQVSILSWLRGVRLSGVHTILMCWRVFRLRRGAVCCSPTSETQEPAAEQERRRTPEIHLMNQRILATRDEIARGRQRRMVERSMRPIFAFVLLLFGLPFPPSFADREGSIRRRYADCAAQTWASACLTMSTPTMSFHAASKRWVTGPGAGFRRALPFTFEIGMMVMLFALTKTSSAMERS